MGDVYLDFAKAFGVVLNIRLLVKMRKQANITGEVKRRSVMSTVIM